MYHLSDIHLTILQLLAECGWVSPDLIGLTGYSYTYRTRALKLLLQQGLVRKQGEGQAKAYAISTKGRNHLATFNASRFRDDVMSQLGHLTRNADDRAVLRGDAAAFFSLAGYAVHPDDKPEFPVCTPSLPTSPERTDWTSLFQNIQTYQYPDEQDRAIYNRHLTGVNCYYDAAAIKELFYTPGKDGKGIRYSRACGVVMTPSCLFRIYHCRDVAMKFHIAGERNLQNLLLTDQVFRGFRPEITNTALLLGYDFTALQHILESHFAGRSAKSPVYVKKRERKGYEALKGSIGERVTPGNLGTPSFYLPLRAESLTLAHVMRYPFWQELLIREINRDLMKLDNQPRWSYEQGGTSYFLLFSLCLQQINLMLQTLRLSPNKRVQIFCLDWQESFFRELLANLLAKPEVHITPLSADYINNFQRQLEFYWGGRT